MLAHVMLNIKVKYWDIYTQATSLSTVEKNARVANHHGDGIK